MLFSLLLLACAPNTALIEGIVYERPGNDQVPPLPGATVRMLDAADGAELDWANTDAQGAFTAEVPHGTNLFVEITRDGLRPAFFAAVVGLEEVIIVEPYTLYGYEEADAADVEAAFADCPGGGGGAGLVLGEVRSYELATVISGEHPTIANAQVTLVSEGGDRWDACYYDADGAAYDPEAGVTGDAGQFVVPHVPAGQHGLEIVYDFGGGLIETQTYPVRVDEAPTVSPWFPAWVGLP